MTETKRKRVSDIVSERDIKSWKPGKVVIIKAPCDTGKSYFIKNDLYEYARATNAKILMLIHRITCIDQFRQEIKRDGKDKVIDVESYQKIEYDIFRQSTYPDFSKYSYIVCDECHYFLSDARFNKTTDISFDYIMEQKKTVRIFMSATIGAMECYIDSRAKKKTLKYEIKPDFSYIKSLNFYTRDSTAEELLKRFIDSGEKAIFFMRSRDLASELYTKYSNYSLFLCAPKNTAYKYVDSEQIENMLRNEKFNSQFLITTECFDTGCNIVDTDVKNIVIDITDIDVFVQCIGRKRVQSPNDKINLFVKTIPNQRINGFESKTRKKIEKPESLLASNAQTFINQHPREYDEEGIVYDDAYNSRPNQFTKKVNMLMLSKRRYDIETYERMKELGDYGYCKYIARLFGFYDFERDKYTYNIIYEDYGLLAYLESNLETVRLTSKDREELINKINVRKNGNQLRSLRALNSYLEKRHIPYKIEKYATSRYDKETKTRINYNSAWKLKKIS